MSLRFVDMVRPVAAVNVTSDGLIHFAGGSYTTGADPQNGMRPRTVNIPHAFDTPATEMTNAEVSRISQFMGQDRQYGIFGMDQKRGPILVATGPNTNKSNFTMVDPKFYSFDVEITDWQKQRERFEKLSLTDPIRIQPNPNRYENYFENDKARAAHFAKPEMAATIMTWFEFCAHALFAAGALGLEGTTRLPTSAEFDAMVAGLEYMTYTGQLEQGLRAYGLSQIAEPTKYPKLKNGLHPNTTWNWTTTDLNGRDSGKFPKSFEEFSAILRGASWDIAGHVNLRAAFRFRYGPVLASCYFGARFVRPLRT